MRFLIFGTGGVGGFFGAMLAHAGEDVWFLARGKQLEAMKRTGISVKSTFGNITIPPGKMTDRIKDVDRADIIFFCVKSYDTEAASASLEPVLSERSLIVSLQNGIENEAKIQKIIRKGLVYGGVANVSSRVTAPGEITESGGVQRIVFGPMSGKPDDRGIDLRERCTKAGINAILSDDIRKELWRKFIFITSLGSFTAVSRLTQGEIIASPEALELVLSAMREAESVARASGANLEPFEREKIVESFRRFNENTRSSMYFDLVNEKPLEIEALNGTLIRIAEQHNIPVPIHRTIHAALLPHHLKYIKLRQVNPSSSLTT